MQFTNPVYLITNNDSGVDEKGDIKASPDERKVYASVDSVRQSEFYQAQASGFKAEMTVLIRDFEYRGEKTAKIGEIEYRILRTYDKKDGTIELILTKGVNNGTS